VGAFGTDIYKTAICDWFERDVEETFDKDDMEFEIDGRKGFAGTIAKYEDEYGGSGMFGETKFHEDNKIRLLLSIFRYIHKYSPSVNSVRIVTGQPIKQHKQIEKKGIIDMLKGPHR
jgi:plasmid segregation protein ParM